jgi:hypothetical protein
MPDILITPPIRTPLISSDSDATAGTAPDSSGVIRTTRDWWLYWNRLGAQANSNAKLVTQGTHADRPTATDSPDGAIYVETDRGAIYQARNGVWQYLAGTMWGTVTPDERPTDLGVNDGGFDFRGTDDAREFIWSQTQWIEVTEVRYGTHAGRPNPLDVVNGALYVEFDRGGAIYQNQNNVWKYLAGTMWGTLSPDQRPSDLGVDDGGFDFRATDQQREFIWSQTVWVEVTPVTGALNLTHPNVVTKVGTAGQIVEGGITDQSAGNSDKVHITAAGLVGIAGTPLAQLQVVTANDTNPSNMPVWDSRHFTVGQSGNTGGIGISYNNTNGYGVIQAISPGAAWRSLVLQSGGGFVGIGLGGPPGYQLQLGIDSAGKPATSSWSVYSDLRLKQNIEPVQDDSLAILGQLNWIRYEYNGQANTPRGLKAIGLVAQALQQQLPEAVRSSKTKLNETDDGETDVLAIDYHHILVHMARAIQQLNAEVKNLRVLLEKSPS